MERQSNRKVLLICDLAGYGKVALSALIPIFSHMKCETFNLPTAIVSNTFDYGKFDILDTTEYMRNTIRIWGELGFEFDAVCTGFIQSEEQSQLVFDYCSRLKADKGAKIFVDPVMGDKCVLYNGVSESSVYYMKKMCAISDLVVPNVTEACFLTGFEPSRREGDKYLLGSADMDIIIARLREMGSRSIAVTSANVDGVACTVIFEPGMQTWKALPYHEVPVEFSGTGDLFTSLVSSNILNGASLEASATSAMDIIERLIRDNRDNLDKYKGIPIEQYLDTIKPV